MDSATLTPMAAAAEAAYSAWLRGDGCLDAVAAHSLGICSSLSLRRGWRRQDAEDVATDAAAMVARQAAGRTIPDGRLRLWCWYAVGKASRAMRRYRARYQGVCAAILAAVEGRLPDEGGSGGPPPPMGPFSHF